MDHLQPDMSYNSTLSLVLDVFSTTQTAFRTVSPAVVYARFVCSVPLSFCCEAEEASFIVRELLLIWVWVPGAAEEAAAAVPRASRYHLPSMPWGWGSAWPDSRLCPPVGSPAARGAIWVGFCLSGLDLTRFLFFCTVVCCTSFCIYFSLLVSDWHICILLF